MDPEKKLDLDPLSDSATVDDVAKRLLEIGQFKDACLARMHELTEWHDVLYHRQQMEQRVAEMSDPERAALTQIISVGSLPASARVAATRSSEEA